VQLSVLAIGRRMPDWVDSGVNDYVKRLPKAWQFRFSEFAQAKSKGGTAQTSKALEAEVLLNAVPEKAWIVALDNRGVAHTTNGVKNRLEHWQSLGRPVTLMIGGPDGLHDKVLAASDEQWSLSPLTFPHPLVRVILVEQLYRAHSLSINHPYHRA